MFEQRCVTRRPPSCEKAASNVQVRPFLTLSVQEPYGSGPLTVPCPALFHINFRHVKADLGSLLCDVPGRRTETVYSDEPYWVGVYMLSSDSRRRGNSSTPQNSRLYCVAHSDNFITDLLPGFTHDDLRELYSFVVVGEYEEF